MGCVSSTAVGYLLSEEEAAELAILEPHEEVRGRCWVGLGVAWVGVGAVGRVRRAFWGGTVKGVVVCSGDVGTS